jgi:hypothetical protein
MVYLRDALVVAALEINTSHVDVAVGHDGVILPVFVVTVIPTANNHRTT